MTTLQTLDRGLIALSVISRRPRGILVAELAEELGVHRAIAYRIVATLAEHGYVARLDDGRIRLGGSVLDLAGRYAPQFREANRGVLTALADRTGAAAFITVAEGDHAVAVAVAEPDEAVVRVAYRVGARHPLDRGAAGIAILARRAPSQTDSAEVQRARERGFALSRGELEPGATGLAVGFRSLSLDGEWQGASVGVVTIGELETGPALTAVREAAETLDRHHVPDSV